MQRQRAKLARPHVTLHGVANQDRSKRMDARKTIATAVSLLAVGGSLLASGSAAADISDFRPLDPTLGFTVFVAGDATLTKNENEGSIAIGGDLSLPQGAQYNVGNNAASRWTASGDAKPTALYVAGQSQLTGGSLKVLGGNYAHLVGGVAGGADVVENGGVTQVRPIGVGGGIDVNTAQPKASVLGAVANPIDFRGAFAALRANADLIGRCEANLPTTNANGGDVNWQEENLNVFIRVRSGTNVLNLTWDQLRRIGTLTFRDGMPADGSLVINVTDFVTGAWKAPNYSGVGFAQAKRILINFPSATDLTVTPNSASIEGTILAPGALVSIESSSNVEGAVVVGGLGHTGGGEIHDAPFEPGISCVGPEQPREPEEPENPENPENPRNPENPEQPRNPENPENPQIPEQPRNPETPQTPETPTTPLTPTTPTSPLTPESPTPRGAVRGTVRSGGGRPVAAARITGTVGCVKTTAQATVAGKQIRAVIFRVNGKLVKTVKAKQRVTLRIPVLRLRGGTNTVTAAVTFSSASRAKAKTLSLSFNRCAQGAVKPQFTG